MSERDIFSVSRSRILQRDADQYSEDFLLLRRLKLPRELNRPQSGEVRRGLVIDVETTGLNLEADEVMQLAMLPFDYEIETGRILTVHKDTAFEGLREPAAVISEEASIITGICFSPQSKFSIL